MTTFRKLPIESDRRTTDATNKAGNASKAWNSDILGSTIKDCGLKPSRSRHRNPQWFLSDCLAEFKDGQVHRDNHAADQCAQNHHDHRLHQARESIARVISLGLKEVSTLGQHAVERPRL